jgi:hypothetical protein
VSDDSGFRNGFRTAFRDALWEILSGLALIALGWLAWRLFF